MGPEARLSELAAQMRARGALGDDDLERTLGVALKVREDIERVKERGVLEGV